MVPVYKSGTKNIAGNYRPISILSPFSKILEKLIYVRLEKFLVKNDILSPYQLGFHRNHSTSLASLNLLRNLQLNYDEGYNTCCIFLDLSKAGVGKLPPAGHMRPSRAFCAARKHFLKLCHLEINMTRRKSDGVLKKMVITSTLDGKCVRAYNCPQSGIYRLRKGEDLFFFF